MNNFRFKISEDQPYLKPFKPSIPVIDNSNKQGRWIPATVYYEGDTPFQCYRCSNCGHEIHPSEEWGILLPTCCPDCYSQNT